MRAIGPIKAAAGSTLILRCPFSGYPIEAILWEKSREEILPGNVRAMHSNPKTLSCILHFKLSAAELQILSHTHTEQTSHSSIITTSCSSLYRRSFLF